ncbi:hypothetical protein N7456_011505 [Penicillium angulare]|uniref:Uncharacterized protein n=1 Tax=Penicillium angulare TaxID=116970 RepID=A0A9W9EU17_9EURO|nr:hypothetical protein N7456_011505 [Penicillium angulare]
MILLLLVFCLTTRSYSQSNATTLEGWHHGNNTRSSWDILRTSVFTILACTWTVLHPSVPKRKDSEGDRLAGKIAHWVLAVLAPELVAASAVEGFWRARSIAARCNLAFDAMDNGNIKIIESTKLADGTKIMTNNPTKRGENTTSEINPETEEITELNRTTELGQHQYSDSLSIESTKDPWQSIHGFCLDMDGVLFQTRDGWTWPVHPGNVVPLIQAGIIKRGHLKTREIRDRAKADSFTKAIALLQSSWMICNIIARKAYGLPLSPLEISTIAYIVASIAIYSMFWHKPKDMITQIMIYLPHNRDCDYMQYHLRDIASQNDKNWVRLSDFGQTNESLLWDSVVGIFGLFVLLLTPRGWRIIRTFVKDLQSSVENQQDTNKPCDNERNTEQGSPPKKEQQSLNNVNDDDEYFTIAGSFKLACIDLFITLLFTGIHVAAYVMLEP